jgi:hypothetical protein
LLYYSFETESRVNETTSERSIEKSVDVYLSLSYYKQQQQQQHTHPLFEKCYYNEETILLLLYRRDILDTKFEELALSRGVGFLLALDSDIG